MQPLLQNKPLCCAENRRTHSWFANFRNKSTDIMRKYVAFKLTIKHVKVVMTVLCFLLLMLVFLSLIEYFPTLAPALVAHQLQRVIRCYSHPCFV